MIREFLSIPYHLRIQEKDWESLNKIYPALDKFQISKYEIKEIFKAAHKDYISNYSSVLISMSLNRGTFFYFLCQIIDPKVILDLGSGFSSFLFRSYAKSKGECEVISVDESKYWLVETSRYLYKYNLPVTKMIEWNEYQNNGLPDFDLAFLDIGDLNFRLKILPSLIINIKKNGGIILVDDYHVPFYRKNIKKICNEMAVDIYSLRKVTRTRLSHNALIRKKQLL
jgi:predicted O-methyltransferase YrrM